LRQQAIQEGSHVLSEGVLDDRGKLLTAPIDRAQDQLRQPRVAGHFNSFTHQDIDTAPEDDFGLDLGMNHAGDFFEQETGRLRVEDPETVEGPDRGLVTLLGARMIVGKADGRRYRLKLSRHIFDIPRVESTRREESLRCFEVARAQQKAEAVGRVTEARRDAA
jgi:hypothetical protein